MEKSNGLEIKGWNDSIKVREKTFTKIAYAARYVDGLRLDEMQIGCTLYNADDIDDLIKLLTIARYCFIYPTT